MTPSVCEMVKVTIKAFDSLYSDDCVSKKELTVTGERLMRTDMSGKYIQSTALPARPGYQLRTYKVTPTHSVRWFREEMLTRSSTLCCG